jgi:hypothetical protein
MNFWRASFVGFDDWLETETDAFASWHSLAAALSAHPRPLVVWRAENASETVLLAMTCWWFRDHNIRMLTVEPPDGRHTGIWPSASLAEFSLEPRAVTPDERNRYVADFAAWRSDGGVLRAWRDNAVITVPVDTFDELVLDACTDQWRRAVQIFGQAMTSTDGRNLLSDVFISTRLRAMIADGRLEADVPQTGLHDYSVRFSPIGQAHNPNSTQLKH